MPVYQFDGFEVDAAGYKLLKNGSPVPVEPRVFDMILYLVENAGRVLTREELIDALWQGRFTSDSALTTTVKAARKALDDSGEAQQYIKTVRGRGFEFVGDVAPVSDATTAPARDLDSSAEFHQDISFVSSEDGTQIAVASIGEGPIILRAAHWLSNISLDADSPVFRHWFAALSRHHRFVRYDLRGSGLSDKDPGDISFDAFVADLEAVAQSLDEPVTLFGMSQGGAISIAFAVRYPEKVQKLILCGAYGLGMAARAASERDHVEIETLLGLIHLGWGRENPAFNQVFTHLFIPGGSDEQHAWWRELERNSATPEMAARIFKANNQINVMELAAQLRVPTLIFHSRDDARVPFDLGRRLAATIPDAKFVPLESANHVLLESEPAWGKFLAEFQAF